MHELSTPLRQRQCQFRRWFWATAGLLLFMAIALLVLGFIAPTWLAAAKLGL